MTFTMKNESEIDTLGTTEISVRGVFRRVPALTVNGATVVITGRLLRTGSIKGEGWLDPSQLGAPESILDGLRRSKAKLDLFRFSQHLPDTQPKYEFPRIWDDVAAIPLTDYDDWWEKRASQVTRKNVRRAGRRGVEVRPLDFDDRLIEGIVRINNDTPVRTGRKFWHFGKDFAAVKKDYSSYLDRSEFLGAFAAGEMIGFMRLISMGSVASIMQLLSMNSHFDKRPSNALVAKAVELCIAKGFRYLVYGQYLFDGDANNPLTEFKRRCGFERILIPTYYVPMSFRGGIAVKLGVHAGLRRLVPQEALKTVRLIRAKIVRDTTGRGERDRAVPMGSESNQNHED